MAISETYITWNKRNAVWRKLLRFRTSYIKVSLLQHKIYDIKQAPYSVIECVQRKGKNIDKKTAVGIKIECKSFM